MKKADARALLGIGCWSLGYGDRGSLSSNRQLRSRLLLPPPEKYNMELLARVRDQKRTK